MHKRFQSLFFLLAWHVAAVAFAADAVLGEGDTVKISVYGNPDLALETKISQTGKITYPLLGEVELRNLTTTQAEHRIAQLLERGSFVRNPHVNVLVTSLESQQVSVLGQVNHPGRYPVDGKRSVIDMIALAGGTSAEGGDTITLIRKRNGNAVQETVDVADLIHSGGARNFDIVGGDVIYVERAPRFYIYGEVQRPGVYRLERGMTVVQALSTAGGLSPRGTERGLQIRRRNADGKMETIDTRLDDKVQYEDVLYVKESLF